MSQAPRKVREYLKDLENGKEGRADQVREGLEMFIDLWRKSIENGVISEDDEVPEALRKIDSAGGLYKAAERKGGVIS